MSFISELRRRKVVQVGLIYLASAWLALQVVDVLVTIFEGPTWIARLIALLLALGFLVALVLAWIFDITADGIRRTDPASRSGRMIISSAMLIMFAGAAGVYFYVVPKQAELDRNVVAVMACDNWTGDAELEYVTDGLAEDIMHAVQRLGIQVIGRNSTFSLKYKNLDIPAIAQTLGAAYVLTCSVRRIPQSLRISAQLSDASANKAVWTEDFDRAPERVFDVARIVAAEIPAQMHVSTGDQGQTRLANYETADPDAVDLYWRGKHFSHQLTATGNRRSIELYKEALEIDPNYAEAHAAIADSLMFIKQFEQVPDAVSAEEVAAHLEKALELDSESADVWATYGVFMHDTQRWEQSHDAFQRALDIDANNISANAWVMAYYQTVGPASKQIPYIENAIRLDPLNTFVSSSKIFAYMAMREYENALQASEATIELDPTFWLPYWVRAITYNAMGDYSRMLAEIDKAIELRMPDEPVDLWPYRARALAGLGRVDEAEAILAQTEERSHEQYVPALDFALIYAALGDEEQVLTHLEKAIDDGDWRAPGHLMHSFEFDSVRDTPRFKVLVERMGLSAEGYL
jgi:TolB-like protein/Tfp pilus assembly protein PilF